MAELDASSHALAVAARRSCVRQAMLGTAIWAVWLALVGLRTTDALLLLVALVLHPLVLGLALDDERPSRLFTAARVAQAPGAAALVVSFQTAIGPMAFAWALPWVGATAFATVWAARRAWRRGRADVHELGLDAAFGLLLVGAGWVAATRAGLRADVSAVVQAEHFHAAGLVLPALGTFAARELGARWRFLPLATVLGVVLVAIGGPPAVRVLATSTITLASLAIAGGQLVVARRTGSGWASLLLALSSVALLFSMALAAIHAVAAAHGEPWPSLPDMVVLHGTTHALGTCLLGIWGFAVHAAGKPLR